jgi:hypothetical protein
MNERIEKLVKIARERDGIDLADFIELRDRLEDLLDEEGQKELTTAWETMLNDKALDKWDEDFLKAIDGTYEGEPFGYITKAQQKLQMERRQQEAYIQDLQKQQMLEHYRNPQQAPYPPSYASHQSASSGTGLVDRILGR